MKFTIRTSVNASLSEVKKGFTKDLFLALTPSFPPIKLLQFDGCQTGNKVSLQLNFLLFRQRWVSDITEDHISESEWFFVDMGTELPFFLKSWKHKHIVLSKEGKSQIIDDITFTTGTILTDILLYPALLAQFLYRKPIYKRVFQCRSK